MPSPDQLAAVHHRLRAILARNASGLSTTRDADDGMTLEVPGLEGKPWGYVAGTRVGTRYVSYYLMGVYGDPELLDGMSPELRKRMQGKSCFNFARVDEALFSELAVLTARAIPRQRQIAEGLRGRR